jgi:hypothetical protein
MCSPLSISIFIDAPHSMRKPPLSNFWRKSKKRLDKAESHLLHSQKSVIGVFYENRKRQGDHQNSKATL